MWNIMVALFIICTMVLLWEFIMVVAYVIGGM
ncbi:hypothetical protein LCGC14_0895020 [marine sediment metagenome]|uniref:Uncharacterized protein n=1 Tax=marine sediment metagenome TaxID=412755 RepID=A0A0F9PIW8_9ZZZZ